MKKQSSGPYKIGYGKPPTETRFKPGQSGNPRGRARKNPSVSEIFARELKRRRSIVEDGQRSRVRTDVVLIKRIVDLALKGDLRALKMMMGMMEHVREKEDIFARDFSSMTQAELADYYVKLRNTTIEDFDKTNFTWPYRRGRG